MASTPYHREEKKASANSNRLRVALAQVTENFEKAALFDAIEAATGEALDLSATGLKRFEDGQTKDLERANHDLLSRFLFETALGWMMRHPKPEGSGSDAEFLNLLLVGGHSAPPGVNLQGLYFTYHGSHYKPGHFVVRATKIGPLRDGPLPFVDQLNDTQPPYQYDPMNTHIANGMATFFRELPHFVAVGKDNSIGFRLTIATHVAKDGSRVVGQMLGITKGSQIFSRAVLLKRASPTLDEGEFQSMLAETGIKPLNEHTDKHRLAFHDLAHSTEEMVFRDPILALKDELTAPAAPLKRPVDARASPRADADQVRDPPKSEGS
jgi:hypothetical protein